MVVETTASNLPSPAHWDPHMAQGALGTLEADGMMAAPSRKSRRPAGSHHVPDPVSVTGLVPGLVLGLDDPGAEC